MIDNKMFLFPLLIIATLNAVTAVSTGSSVSCLDEEGNPIDWYIVYKLPQLINQPEPYNSGTAYLYITSDDVKLSSKGPAIMTRDSGAVSESADSSFINRFVDLLQYYAGSFRIFRKRPATRASKASVEVSKSAETTTSEPKKEIRWTLSKNSIVDPKSMVLRTLAVLYDKKQLYNLNSIFYNDGPPETFDGEEVRVNSVRAHAKGVVMIDDKTGSSVWVTHSFPMFPPTRAEGLNLGSNFKRKGQTLMCVNFDKEKSGKQIVNHLINMFPLVYDSYISERLYSSIPELRNLKLNGETRIKRRKKDDDPRLAQTITTVGGLNLNLFSKSSALREDMYASWINDELESKLYVETWRTGNGNALSSSCPRDDYHVNNVQDLKLDTGDNKVSWSYTMDHSKWAISDNQEAGLVCISDVNRMQSQFKRGGGAVCFKCPGCWIAFSNMIADIEPCPVKS